MRIRRTLDFNYTLFMRILSGILLILTMVLTGCGLFSDGEDEPQATRESLEPTPIITPTLRSTPLATPPPGPSTPGTLTVWIGSRFSPQNDPAAGDILIDQIDSFEVSHPELSVNVESKSATGPGGVLSYLRAGADVAPDILPDLIMLPSDQLAAAATEGLIYPLSELLSQEMIDDLFPAADMLGRVDGVLYGYPLALTDLHHLVYDVNEFADTLPETWNELLDIEDVKLALVGDGAEGAEMALQFYLAADGSLLDEANQPVLEIDPLTQALSPFNRAATRRLIVSDSTELSSIVDTWQLFTVGDANIAQNEASAYLREHHNVPDSAPSSVPGFDSPLRPFAKGLVWAISTPDPERQLLATELLSSLASGPNSGDWSFAADRLPARRSAYDRWPINDPLSEYYRQASEHAHQFPPEASESIMNALSKAVRDVISLSKSPRSAAEEAAMTIR